MWHFTDKNMKTGFCIILTVLTILDYCYGQRKDDFEQIYFTPIPKDYAYEDRTLIIDKILPDTNYVYWECLYKDVVSDNTRGKIIVSKGDSLKYSSIAKKKDSFDGFFLECHPLICYSYIIGVKKDSSVEVINSEKKLKRFIGNIDNLEEALLIAKINGLWFDTDTIIGGAYRIREKDYLFYLLDYSSTPVTYKSVKATLTKKGEFKILSREVYKMTDEYYIE